MKDLFPAFFNTMRNDQKMRSEALFIPKFYIKMATRLKRVAFRIVETSTHIRQPELNYTIYWSPAKNFRILTMVCGCDCKNAIK